MRKLGVALLAGTLALAAAAPVSAGQTTINSSGFAVTAQGGWERFDEATGTYEFGWVAAWKEQNQPAFLEFYGGTSQEIVCSPARGNRPATTAFLDTFSYGSGAATLDVSRNYTTASASAVIDVWTSTYNGCTGEYSESFASGVTVTLALTGSGDLVKERGTWSFKIPSQFNGHSRYAVTYRLATGTASLDGVGHDVSGAIGKVSWSEHVNG